VEAVRREMDDAMRAAASELEGRVDVRWTKEYDGFLFPPDDPRVEFVAGACRKTGAEVRMFHTGGGSDGNIFTGHGIPTLVLSSGMTNVHSLQECLRVEDLERLADVVEALLTAAVA
jgi:tripeptide aminopeptidase